MRRIASAACLGLTLLGAPASAWSQRHSTHKGNLELQAEALPASALAAELAARYRVEPAADRGVLLVWVQRRERGHTVPMPAQVYAGAMNRRNLVISIPLREVRNGEAVHYVGEYRISPPDELRFLINANVLGTPLKLEFERAFPDRAAAQTP
ncbi:MAG: DUF4426 domain-containing protein [Thiobacillaceae bacterium]|nr:DUF4426 domain-containing protein [Thiobacillaceae bacterium]MCX7674160.1 DUF4426 domain-containing protein [Thiobacillaceae bacterium]MDW8323597.1 DUF4426 domain-containing protein [Burkholderiales bacterium]